MRLCEDSEMDLMQGLAGIIPDPNQLLEIVNLLKRKSYLKVALILLSASPIVTNKIDADLENVDETTDSWYHFTSDHINTISHFWPIILDQLELSLPTVLLMKLDRAVRRLLAWHIRVRRYHRSVRGRTAQLNTMANRYGQTARHMDNLVRT